MALYVGYLVFTVLLGLCIGSFCNVLIVRIPKGESIISPGSHCPQCNTPLLPKDNIPLLSYITLRGKCRSCAQPISWRYPMVEALVALLFAACYLRFGWGLLLIPACALCALVVTLSLIDMEHHIVPDALLVAGLVLAAIMNGLFSTLAAPLDMLLGVLAGALPLMLIALIGKAAAGRDVLGGGDIKLMGMVGAFLGWQGALLALAFGSVAGGVIVLILMAAKIIHPRQEIPFVPLLALGSILSLLIGKPLLSWYLGIFS